MDGLLKRSGNVNGLIRDQHFTLRLEEPVPNSQSPKTQMPLVVVKKE